MTDAFKIQILEQGWIEEGSSEWDQCSHGKISLVIGGTRIADEEEYFGISESALAMLRTLESDHSQNEPVYGEQVRETPDPIFPQRAKRCGIVLEVMNYGTQSTYRF